MIFDGLTKLMPMFMTVGGIGAAGDKLPQMMEKAANTAKSGITFMVLKSVRDAISLRNQMGQELPEPGSEGEMQDFFQDAAVMTIGKEPWKDMWENSYELHKATNELWIVLSVGPNGFMDGNCLDGKSFGMITEEEVAQMAKEIEANLEELESLQLALASGEMTEEELEAEYGFDEGDLNAMAEPDDICVPIRLDTIAEY